MDTQIKTVVIKKSEACGFKAEYESTVKRVNDRRAWQSFGTLSYDEYVAWILSQG